MEARQLDGCCGIVEIHDLSPFYPYDTPWNQKKYKEKILSVITEFFKEELNYNEIYQLPSCFIATTNSREQPEQELALEELGFRAKSFCGRGIETRTNKNLKFWMKTSIPKEIMPELMRIRKEYKEANF